MHPIVPMLALLLVPLWLSVLLTVIWRRSLSRPWLFLILSLLISSALYVVVAETFDQLLIDVYVDGDVERARRIEPFDNWYVRRGLLALVTILVGTPLLWWVSRQFRAAPQQA